MKKQQSLIVKMISNRIPSTKASSANQLGLSDRLDLDRTTLSCRSYDVSLDAANIPKSELELLLMQSCALLPWFFWHVTPPQIMSMQEFATINELAQSGAADTSEKPTAVLVVHGFNTNPLGALERIAYLTAAIDDANIHVYGFDWACLGGLKANYLKQGSPAHCSSLDFQAVVLMLADLYDKLIIVTHSMGAEVALPALARISMEMSYRRHMADRLIMAEPDVARMDHRKLYAQPVRQIIKSDRIEVLISHFDMALVASWALRFECDRNGDWHDTLRLGCPLNPAYIEGTHYEDVSILDISGLPLGHNMSDFYIAAKLKGQDHAGDPNFEKVIRPGGSSITRLVKKEKNW